MSEPSAIGLMASFDDSLEDAPVLVLGPSLGTSRMIWDQQVEAFSERFRLLRFELPGHGGAGSPSPPYSIDDLGAGVLALLDDYGIETAGYCGISLGGMIGMWLAAHAHDRIQSLGLVCTSAYMPPAESWRARAELVLASGMTPVVEASLGRWFMPEFTEREPEVITAYGNELRWTNSTGYAGCCLALADMDLRADLDLIKAPALVIAGGRDPATPPEHGAVIADGIAGARLLVVDDAAHLANVSSPEVVTAALLEHLSVTMLKR
jgi:3-oxoadipate enol-lactonase